VGGFSGSSYLMKTQPRSSLRVIAMATNFGTKIAITGFVRKIATRQLVMEGGLEYGERRPTNS